MRRQFIFYSIMTAIILLGLVLFVKLTAPAKFPVGAMYTVEAGSGLNSLAADLKNKDIIKSPFLFKVFSVLFGGPRGIIAGDYILDKKQNAISLARRIANGDFDLTPIKVTIPEGLNTYEIAKLISSKFAKIDEKKFSDLAKPYEGYLFPDTYFFLPNVKAEEIVDTMQDGFKNRIKTLQAEISNFKQPEEDVIKMASIVEEEARTEESRRIVAGILWKRLNLKMPLQVDASFKYINGKTTATLSLDDLKIDSPYNSYLYKGLPPTPISNPGLASIRATITPIQTDYLFFLSDKKGNMHYARNYAEHLQNKQIYLK